MCFFPPQPPRGPEKGLGGRGNIKETPGYLDPSAYQNAMKGPSSTSESSYYTAVFPKCTSPSFALECDSYLGSLARGLNYGRPRFGESSKLSADAGFISSNQARPSVGQRLQTHVSASQQISVPAARCSCDQSIFCRPRTPPTERMVPVNLSQGMTELENDSESATEINEDPRSRNVNEDASLPGPEGEEAASSAQSVCSSFNGFDDENSPRTRVP